MTRFKKVDGLAEVAKIVNESEFGKADKIAKFEDVDLVGNKVIIDNIEYLLNNTSLNHLLKKLKIPVGYAKRTLAVNEDLLTKQLKFWQQENKDKQLLFRVRDNDNTVRAVLSDRYVAFDYPETVEMLNDVLPKNDFEVEEFIYGDTKFHLRLSFDEARMATTAYNDDRVRIGVDIENSEVGNNCLRVTPLVYRLICANGLRVVLNSGTQFKQRHIGIDKDKLWEETKVAIATANEEAQSGLQVLEKSREIEVNPEKLLTNVYNNEGIVSKANTKEILELINDNKLYDVINGFTRIAQNGSNERRVMLEDVAGRLLKRAA